MIEVRNLTKIYKVKKKKKKEAVEVRALDDVSVSFGETGLVFVLGKSGCGKSTLLNIIGGLDAPTSGEVIVMGKSSKDFTEKDFDSYRNTFVGFVFQEYNVLDEFTVADNVALALQLQKQENVKERVQEILREVELDDMADRKPSALSGGQKQRVAIARVLVKNPQIIMADEPTGALDSNTGRQVLDTLKQLSSTRLVIVVTHDREFAESYGDRIIELKDGRIVSDITRIAEAVPAKPDKKSEGIKSLEESLQALKSGDTLSAENLARLQELIAEQQNRNEEGVAAEGGMTPESPEDACTEGMPDGFCETAKVPERAVADKASYKDAKLISSSLPFKTAFRMGASSLKCKPVRLAFTIILSLVAFVVFGLLSCFMAYNGTAVAAKSFMQGYDDYLNISKYYTKTTTTVWPFVSNNNKQVVEEPVQTRFTAEDIEGLGLDPDEILYGCDFSSLGTPSNVGSSLERYILSINKAVYVPEKNELRSKVIYGSYPEEPSDGDDTDVVNVCISSYYAEAILDRGYYAKEYDEEQDRTVSKNQGLETMDELIGKELTFSRSGKQYIICGIIETGDASDGYREYYSANTNYNTSRSNYSLYIQDGLYTAFFTTKSFIEDYMGVDDSSLSDYTYGEMFDSVGFSYYISPDNPLTDGSWTTETRYFRNYDGSRLKNYTYFLDGTERRTSLDDDELILPIAMIRAMLNGTEYSNPTEGVDFSNEWTDTAPYVTASYNYTDDELAAFTEAAYALDSNYYSYYDKDGNLYSRLYTDEERAEQVETVTSFLNKCDITLSLYQNKGMDQMELFGQYKIAGFYRYYNYYDRGIYCSDSVYESLGVDEYTIVDDPYTCPEDAFFTYLIVPLQRNAGWLKGIMKQMENPDKTTAVYFTISNNIYNQVSNVNGTIRTLSTVFLVVGIVFALFAALLLFNFISASISSKQKEIGILRAVGARGTDVFKIFFSESAVIAVICFVLSIIITALLAGYVNDLVFTGFEVLVSIVVFSGWSVLMLLAIAAVVAFLGTFIPVYLASKKKPAEAIRTL
ncbi:MAG: ATP-binding cassette domain-containing protein [Clostridia bacterium]|nr:ATP-binding cassette domain-containing protein [Clostridia bacterium]